MMASSAVSFAYASVAKPERIECPANRPSRPAAAARRFTMFATARSLSRVVRMRPCRSMARKAGPLLMPDAATRSPRSYRTGRRVRAVGKSDGRGFAFLVGFGAVNQQPQSVVVFGDVFDVESHE